MEDTKILPTFAPAIRQGAIAQLVEQRTENPCVPGSIPGGTTCESNRKVAQLVAHYVRDVGVGRSSRLFPTKRKSSWTSFFVFSHRQKKMPLQRNGIYHYSYLLPSISLHKVWQRIIILGIWNGPLKMLPFAG